MVDRGRNSSRMLIGRDRLFYWGLAGTAMQARRLGSFTIYALPDSQFEIMVGDGPWERRSIAAVAPFTPHRLRSDCGWITSICIEPETVAREDLVQIDEDVNSHVQGRRMLDAIHAARRELLTTHNAGGFTTAEFDRVVLRRALAPRRMDPRIARILDQIVDEAQEDVLAASVCARNLDLSTSRFLHLYKEFTDIPFRSQRMWKRARRFLDHAATQNSLTDVALGLGYPDSSHFSHTIRATFGLMPRSIRQGSRGMRICLGENYVAPLDHA